MLSVGTASLRFVFSIAATSALTSKCLHIHVHRKALTSADLTIWSLSLFAQDTAILLLLRLLLHSGPPPRNTSRYMQATSFVIASTVALIQLAVATINTAFFLVIGSEPRWRNAGIITDPSTWSTFAEGLPTCMMTFAGLVFASFALMGIPYFFAGVALHVIKASSAVVVSGLRCCSGIPARPKYGKVPRDEEEPYGPERKDTTRGCRRRHRRAVWLIQAVTGAILVAQAIAYILRPNERSLIFLSWTSVALPIVDILSTTSPLTNLLPVYNPNLIQRWEGKTALGEPRRWAWLPNTDDPPAGFGDWYDSEKKHYSSDLDPLSQANVENDLLGGLRGKLADVDIRHVMVILLESTRHDVFPFKKDGYIWKKLEETWKNQRIPDDVEERLANLTSSANFITGDYDDGFDHAERRRRGGINAVHGTPSATYTVKSCLGTLCGISPLAVDGNHEYYSHLYQPCLSHIINLFNAMNGSAGGPASRPYTEYSWNSSFLMSVTGQYDSQDRLMKAMGYTEDGLIDVEYLEGDRAVFEPPHRPYVNYMGWEEEALEEYIADAFESARENNTRLFLTHLTSTPHYPYEIPEAKEYVALTPEDSGSYANDMSMYLNAVGYVDRWIAKILRMIEEQDATNETLIVLVGDHGLPLPETGGMSPWGIPNIGGFRVPLVFSHPGLPAIEIQESVTAMSVAPTILDLLIETGSLSMPQQRAARDLLGNYEAPSLIRSLEGRAPDAEQRWQLTAVSPSGQGVSVRSMDEPRWRLVAPLIEDLEWLFGDLEDDPHEDDPIRSFDFAKLLQAVEEKYGTEAAEWAEEAAFVTRWWVKENHERWRYSPG
ncbi:sulfatase domain protein [Metarhizium album ARSEF 1941]|uniref:Sulfatase domain protein n=1 Tax=Metarhizium album (strain ARSEF 1941) TaxID=1081103 RepID=A0A0B2WE25_METAS|nr:sulfatase domain protein [Metarhizium album ARSEF 1941]KHN94121.1 sulfatase domain protein [Metarhizium album ARSEF 1941]